MGSSVEGSVTSLGVKQSSGIVFVGMLTCVRGVTELGSHCQRI